MCSWMKKKMVQLYLSYKIYLGVYIIQEYMPANSIKDQLSLFEKYNE